MSFSNKNYTNFETFEEQKLDLLIQLGKDLNEDVLSEMLATYFSSTGNTIQLFKENYIKSDYLAISRLAHKHKSSCGQLGLNKLNRLCTDLESYLKTENSLINADVVLSFLNAIYLEIDITNALLNKFIKVAA